MRVTARKKSNVFFPIGRDCRTRSTWACHTAANLSTPPKRRSISSTRTITFCGYDAIYTQDEFYYRSIWVRHPITFTEVRLIRIATQTAAAFPATTLTPEAEFGHRKTPMAVFAEAEL